MKTSLHINSNDYVVDLNEKTARSQYYGGMVWGIGIALTEKRVYDDRDGHIINNNLAEYQIPVNLDAPQLIVIF